MIDLGHDMHLCCLVFPKLVVEGGTLAEGLAAECLAHKSLAPKGLATKVLAPKVLAPKALAPKVLAPKGLAPKSLAPEALALKGLTPRSGKRTLQPILPPTIPAAYTHPPQISLLTPNQAPTLKPLYQKNEFSIIFETSERKS